MTPVQGRLLYLCDNAALLSAQLQGQRLTRAQAGALRDDISTDEITPLPSMVHFDATLGRHAHTGLTVRGATPGSAERPIAVGALQSAGICVLVGGRRYGKGSSREHSPLAELSAGVRLVVAESFERLYRQNADNLGLLTSTRLELLERLDSGQAIAVEELLADRDAQAAAILRAGGLLRHGTGPATALEAAPACAQPDTSHPPATPALPQTLFHKIVARHRLNAGFVRTDWRFIHEYYTGMCAHLLQGHARTACASASASASASATIELHRPESILCFEDHLAYVDESPVHLSQGLVSAALRLSTAHRAFVQAHGLRDHGPMQALAGESPKPSEGSEGISHALVAERYAQPGQLIAGTDSHTPHSGALGCVAIGVGTTDMANAFLTGAVRLGGQTEVLRVQVDGELAPGVSAKDLVLHLLALPDIRQGAGLGRVFEFGGSAVRQLSTDERATLTNMSAELGGLTGIVEPDAETQRFLRQRRGIDFQLEPWMRSDPGAPYAAELRLDAHEVSPMVARPGDPGRGLPLAQLPAAERPRIDIAYGGSCTAGKRADFEQYHAVLAWGARQGLRVPDHVRFFLQFGTRDVAEHAQRAGWLETFAFVGARILQPACGACANCGPGSSTTADQVTVSAINRNFPGRSGPGQVWLASPATVAASALAGELIGFAELQRRLGPAA